LEEKLPVWCLLKKIPIELSPKEALGFAKERIDKFARRESWSVQENSSEDIIQEFAGHILLRVAAASDPKFSAWLVEFEGDLFDNRLTKASFSDVMTLIHYFFDQDKDQDKNGQDKIIRVKTLEEIEEELDIDLKIKYQLIELREFSRYEKKRIKESDGRTTIRIVRQTKSVPKALRKHVGIHFTKVPILVSKRRMLLLGGWAIAPLFIFQGSIKRAFEDRLRIKIQEIQELVKDDNSLRPIIRELKAYMKLYEKEFVVPSKTEIGIKGVIYNRLDLFPECMNQLLLTLTEIGHLPHGERWVLGVFLKQLGMSAEDQKRFWYQRAVDNIGLTFEDFSAKVGYSIDHLYGKVGSGVDYNTPKCETIISTYFCPFAKKSADEIGMRFQKEFEEKEKPTEFDQILEDLIEHMINNQPRTACAKLFELRYGKKVKRINHPLIYTREAADLLKEKMKKNVKEKNQTEIKEDLNK